MVKAGKHSRRTLVKEEIPHRGSPRHQDEGGHLAFQSKSQGPHIHRVPYAQHHEIPSENLGHRGVDDVWKGVSEVWRMAQVFLTGVKCPS